jgi:uncharacterized protein (TIGR03435 family)
MLRRVLWICVVTGRVALGQQLAFDAASVKPAAQVEGLIEPIKQSTPGRVTIRNYVVKKLVMEAYQLTRYQVEGPPWIERERFDIIATKPKGTTGDQEREMLQRLLAERFHVAQHRETRQLPSYVLLPGKDTAKLHPVTDNVESGCARAGTMAQFADRLATILDKPVIDETGVSGQYYFVLSWSPQPMTLRSDGAAAPPPPPPPPAVSSPGCPAFNGKILPIEGTIFDAVREQMGLRLERRGTVAVSVIVLDRVERPTPN